MSYADYAYYTGTYGGKAVKQEDFPRLAAKASAYLDNITFGRAAENADDERLKNCCCDLCDSLLLTDGSGGMVKQSESVGSWSYTLASSSEVASETVMVRAICRAWLPAEWLYRGVARE